MILYSFCSNRLTHIFSWIELVVILPNMFCDHSCPFGLIAFCWSLVLRRLLPNKWLLVLTPLLSHWKLRTELQGYLSRNLSCNWLCEQFRSQSMTQCVNNTSKWWNCSHNCLPSLPPPTHMISGSSVEAA